AMVCSRGDEPWGAQEAGAAAYRNCVGEREDVEKSPGVLFDALGGRQVRGGRDRVEPKSLATRLDELAQRAIGRVPAAVLVGRDHRLRRAGPLSQLDLAQAPPSSHGPDEPRRFHLVRVYRFVYGWRW